MSLMQASVNKKHTISQINTQDQAMKDFLFTLGCYPGEGLTLLSRAANYIIEIKGAKYTIDQDLAQAIELSDKTNLAAVS